MFRTLRTSHLRVLQNNHNHILAGHFGQNQTLELVRRNYTWPQMREYVRHYIKSCTVCGCNKTPRHRPYGLLKPLPVLGCPWDSISMDFIEQLLDSNGFTTILVVIDCTSKQAIFIPTHNTINSEELTRLFIIHVFSKHGIPNHITNITVHPEHDITSTRAHDFIVNLDELHQFLCNEITQAQSRYKIEADKCRNPAPLFKVGDKVFLSSKHIKTTHPTAKFAEKFLGPFEIISQPGSHSFMLKLPSDLRTIHPVFHISQLEPVEENTIPNRTQPPPPPVEVEGEEQYKIAHILDSKLDRWFWCPLLYRIQWLGYEGTDEEFAWLLATEFSADDFIEDFHRCYPDKPGPLAKVTIRKSII